ncbi:DNA replication endonuclease-helicase Dna2 [Lithohypha guttulata]|uniref:DNA replication endonuclease-helicase Dna2 n=1 Tax=Lithohypha guttulata TaxID=1690604 RepID=UPI002DE1C879|nr:DNA replication endonuclease-helicase Dna2 [Lithohypha guttulata]
MPSVAQEASIQVQPEPIATDGPPLKPVSANSRGDNDVERNDSGKEQNTSQIQLPPKTPGRISLSDLVANPEDLLDQLPSATPYDQVTWNHIPGLLETPSSSVSSIRRTQRSRKRAQSSSPVSSQGRKAKNSRTDDSLNLKSISQSLQKSPVRRSPNHDDPAAVLWNHYAEKRGHEPALPPIHPIEFSPGSSESRKDNGFRRTASCGNEWPTSKAKRRKVIHYDPHSTTKQIFASRRKDILKQELPQQSKVSILLESVQQSFVARAREHDEPSSSSPLPAKAGTEEIHDHAADKSRQPTPSPQKRLQPPASMPHGSSPLKARTDVSSDYGDLDFDDEELGDIEQALTQGNVQSPDANPPHVPFTKNSRCGQSVVPAPARVQQSRPTSQQSKREKTPEPVPSPAKDDFDLLGDFDDDDFNDELQQLVETIDSQQAVRNNDPVSGKPAVATTLDGTFDDDYDEDLMNDLVVGAVHRTATGTDAQNENRPDNRTIKRYLILEVYESTYEIGPGRKRPEKVLSIKDEKTKQLYTVVLRQSWYENRCVRGSFIHLIGNFDRQGQCIVDDNQNMVIIHPDHLISATVIGDAISCLRRAVLRDRVKATAPPEKSQVYGHILHEIFGEAMRLNDWEWQTFQQTIDRLLPTYLESLYEIGVQIPDATEHLMSKVPLLKAWAELFVSATFNPDAVIRNRQGTLVPMAINKLLEVEEHVWSPMYGLKGNIDATVQAQLHIPTDSQPKTLVVPLELKTGMKDNNEAHRAQTALYTLLLSDRYDVDVTSGILYYMETSKTYRVEGVRNEIRQMLIWRNLLASYSHDKSELPPMLRKEHLCKSCYAQTACFTYHKLIEGGTAETSGLRDVFDNNVSHLRPQHQVFFKQWDELLTKEERDCMRFRRELWTMLSREREQVGRCFSSVVIEPGSAMENLDGPKINRHTYSFVKQKMQPTFLFTESQISVGEPIVISDEKGHFALANGYVTSVRPRRITVAVDRRLQNARKKTRDFDAQHNQSFVGIMEVRMAGVPASSILEDEDPILYRIDKDEFSNGMATVRNNLIKIMEKDLFRAKDLRELIVDLKAPAFKHLSTAYSLSGPASQQSINVDQRAAIEKVMSAKDYALVLGMPGTGKTTTIAHIIRALVSQGKSILLTSYTHTAVDNILLKIKDDNIPILRLGSNGKVHPDVQTFADLSSIPKKSMEELERSWADSKVVATTCLSINYGIFNHRIFDYCIVDEASQITLPVCLGPIRMAHTFILVGDHYQLPPLVQNKEALEGGLDISLFKLLSDAQPSSVVNLEHQYRMAEDIMLLSNELIYNGRLKCGTSAVATRTLGIPNLQAALDAHHHPFSSSRSGSNISSQSLCSANHANCYLRLALLPSNRVMFLNTDTIVTPEPAVERLVGSNQRITNPTESLIIAHLLTTLIRSGVPAKSIGVITFYRSQLALLRHDVKAIAGTTAASEVEMHTADKYQGRDKELILLSCVRSNSARSVGDLLKDWRRVNVALTRAKSKLLIVGSKSTLENSGVPVLEGLIRIVDKRKWVLNLPEDATGGGHRFETVVPSQTQPPSAAPSAKNQTSTTREAGTGVRQPLRLTDANSSIRVKDFAYTTSAKIAAPFKPPQPKKVQPNRIIQGKIDVENLLDKRPIMRDVVNAMAPPAVHFSADDFDDDEDMILD